MLTDVLLTVALFALYLLLLWAASQGEEGRHRTKPNYYYFGENTPLPLRRVRE
jgi:hypothetical protein